MKKTLTSVAIIAIIIITAFTGCKKGAEDPTISLLSRKARLTGTWVIKEGDWTTTDYNTKSNLPFTPYISPELMAHIYGKAHINTTTYNFSGGKLTITNDGDSYTEDYLDSVIFNKDGSFIEYKNEHYIDGNYTYDYTSTTEGFWYFLPKNKQLEVKNKQRVMIELTKSDWSSTRDYSGTSYTSHGTRTYDGTTGENNTLFDFKELSNKEIIIELNSKVTKTDGDYDETVGTVTYTQVK